MVMPIVGPLPRLSVATQFRNSQRYEHSGQDPQSHHNRGFSSAISPSSRNTRTFKSDRSLLHRRQLVYGDELISAFAIEIDINLLCGNLDQDIAILNIVD